MIHFPTRHNVHATCHFSQLAHIRFLQRLSTKTSKFCWQCCFVDSCSHLSRSSSCIWSQVHWWWVQRCYFYTVFKRIKLRSLHNWQELRWGSCLLDLQNWLRIKKNRLLAHIVHWKLLYKCHKVLFLTFMRNTVAFTWELTRDSSTLTLFVKYVTTKTKLKARPMICLLHCMLTCRHTAAGTWFAREK